MKNIILTSVLATSLLSGTGIATLSSLNKDITLVVKGEERQVSTFSNNVEEVLKEHKVEYDKNDIINLSLDTKLEDGLEVEVIDVEKKVLKEPKKVEFETKVIKDSEIKKGETVISTEGEHGENELVYDITYHNGEEVKKEFVEEVVVKEVVHEVVLEGTKVEEEKKEEKPEAVENQVVVASFEEDSEKITTFEEEIKNEPIKEEIKEEPIKEDTKEEVVVDENKEEVVDTNKPTVEEDKEEKPEIVESDRVHMVVESSAYCTGTITSTGTKPRWGVIAVDPNVIPYGTKVYIPQFNQVFVAEDTGSAIKGNKIDIFMNSKSEALNWGRRNIDIYVLK